MAFRKQLEAFTIPELLVTLILTSVLMSSLYYSYLFINQQSLLFEKNTNSSVELSRFHSRLVTDIDQASTIISFGSALRLTINGEPITYYFKETSIERRHNTVNFDLPCYGVSTNFRYQQQKAGFRSLVDYIEINLTHSNHEYHWVIAKEYGTNIIINFNESEP